MAESLKERQENELEVLHAIFMDDFQDLRASKENTPPYIQLKLQPCESMRQNESHVSLDLLVKYPEDYPNRSPELKLENEKGLPKDKVNKLEKDIQCKAAELVGEVMVLEIAQHVQDFLHCNNVPPPPSFYDEMMQKKKKEMEQQEAAEKEKKEKERKANVIQIEKEEQELREEMRRREEAKKSLKRNLQVKENLRVELMSQNAPNRTEKEESAAYERTKRESISEETVPYDGLRVFTFQNKKQHIVHRGKCLGCGPSGSTVFCGLDIITGQMVALSQWQFKGQVPKRPMSDKTKLDDEKLLKHVSSIEQEIASLITRVNHWNLVHYLGVIQLQENNSVTLQILTEFIAGGSLSKELRPGGLPIEIVREYGQQLLEVLAYLHNKSIVHKDVKLTSVFIDNEKRIRLADFSVGRRLRDLYQAYGDVKSTKKTTTQETKTYQKHNKKMDILNLGLLMLSLLQGDIVGTAPANLPQSFPAEVQDFFARCLYPDDKEQWSAHQLLNHKFIAPPVNNTNSNNALANGDGIESFVDPSLNAQENHGADAAFESVSEIPFSCVNVLGKSRLKNEFEVLQWLGKGGFGSVVKVRNNLDGCLYAIKIIPLNPRSIQFNRKITREVKLLSRLNHENIVRYYNSWIEVEEEPDTESSSSEVKSSGVEVKGMAGCEDSLMNVHAIEAPSIRGSAGDEELSWASENTEEFSGGHEMNSFSSSDDEQFEPIKVPAKLNESSEDIMFTRNIDESYRQFGSSLASVDEESDSDAEEETRTGSTQDMQGGLQHLYIQMEYCEKSTLRSVIDEGLFKSQDRIWRLLREIVEGLVHVHSQGMIHRDLKPVNIFLDSNDRVKIGDFGLATTHPSTKAGGAIHSETGEMPPNKTNLESTPTNDSMTGKVGTALYVSPELEGAFNRTRYTQKVDLYSLGIIFFEMCYRPLETTMERTKILGNLRTKKIILPHDFDTKQLEKQALIIRWLLDHNPVSRPTSEELLKSQHIPPKIEDNELEEILNHTLATTNSTRYRTLISIVMNQKIAQHKLDLTYDYDLVTAQFSGKHAVAEQQVQDKLVSVFRRHGFLLLNTPLLVPKTELCRQADTSVTMMDHSGAILTLPYDLRTSLARYLARNNFPSVKRYSISRVYRDTRILSVHPREYCECAVDIASGSPSDYVPDAEILCVVAEVIEQFPSLSSRNYYIRMNHAVLTKSILAANGVQEEKIPDVITLLQEARSDIDRLKHLTKFLESLSLSEQTVIKICRWLLAEIPMDEARAALGNNARGRRTVNHRVRNAMQDLEKLVAHARRMGLTLKVMLYPSLVYNIQYASGALFQFVAKKKRKVDILAAGGRYDNLVSLFTRGWELPSGYGAVGVSISVDRVIQSVIQEPEATTEGDECELRTCDVLVCAVGENPLLEERTSIVHRIRSQLNMSASIRHEPLTDALVDETQAYCRDCGIQYLVIMEENAPTMIKLIDKDKEIKGVDDPVEFLRQKQEPVETTYERESAVNYKSTPTSNESNAAVQPKFNIEFVTQEKLERNAKRRFESHMVSKVTHILQSFSGNKSQYYLILGVDLPVSVLTCISTLLDLSEESKFSASVKIICDKQVKYRKHIPTVCDKICEEKTALSLSVLFLFSSTDEHCVVMPV